MYTKEIIKLDEVTHQVKVLPSVDPYAIRQQWNTYIVCGIGTNYRWVNADYDEGPNAFFNSLEEAIASIEDSISDAGEAAYERFCSNFYGGSGPVTSTELYEAASALKAQVSR